MKIRPLHERVIIRPAKAAEMTEGGIFIPESAQEVPTQGTVISIGNLVNKEGEALKSGDKVLTMKHAGLPIEVNGEELRMIMVNDIIAIIEEE